MHAGMVKKIVLAGWEVPIFSLAHVRKRGTVTNKGQEESLAILSDCHRMANASNSSNNYLARSNGLLRTPSWHRCGFILSAALFVANFVRRITVGTTEGPLLASVVLHQVHSELSACPAAKSALARTMHPSHSRHLLCAHWASVWFSCEVSLAQIWDVLSAAAAPGHHWESRREYLQQATLLSQERWYSCWGHFLRRWVFLNGHTLPPTRITNWWVVFASQQKESRFGERISCPLSVWCQHSHCYRLHQLWRACEILEQIYSHFRKFLPQIMNVHLMRMVHLHVSMLMNAHKACPSLEMGRSRNDAYQEQDWGPHCRENLWMRTQTNRFSCDTFWVVRPASVLQWLEDLDTLTRQQEGYLQCLRSYRDIVYASFSCLWTVRYRKSFTTKSSLVMIIRMSHAVIDMWMATGQS